MSLYLEQIRQLVELQSVDDAIHDVQKELDHAPQELDALKKRFSMIDTQRSRILEKLEHLKDQEKRLDNEIDDDTSRMRKSKSKMMQVSNTREFHAMSREVDTMERNTRSREEERGSLLEEKKHQEKALQEIDEVWMGIKAELEVKEEGLEGRLVVARARLTELDEVRSHTGSQVPTPVLTRYEFIRRRLEHPVIVSVTAGICSGCRIAIPPQTFIELQGGNKIINCPNCQRLIYWVEHFNDTSAGESQQESEA